MTATRFAAFISASAFLILAMNISIASAISCYSCYGTRKNSSCESDYQGLVNASVLWNNGTIVPGSYVNNCSLSSESGWDYCMILTREDINTGVYFYQRACTGFPDTQMDDVRFRDINPRSNSTTCSSTLPVVCYTYCHTDLCNGPQRPAEAEDDCADYNATDPNITKEMYDRCAAASLKSGNVLFQSVTIILLMLFYYVVI